MILCSNICKCSGKQEVVICFESFVHKILGRCTLSLMGLKALLKIWENIGVKLYFDYVEYKKKLKYVSMNMFKTQTGKPSLLAFLCMFTSL